MGLSGYMAIVIAILLAALAGTGALLKASYKANGALEAAAELNVAEMQKATDKVDELRRREATLQTNILSLGHENSILQSEMQVVAEKYNKWRSTLDTRTLANPEATRRAARRAIRVRQCDLWRDTGGVGACPR